MSEFIATNLVKVGSSISKETYDVIRAISNGLNEIESDSVSLSVSLNNGYCFKISVEKDEEDDAEE